MKNLYILTSIVFSILLSSVAQAQTVTGKIKGNDNEPLVGAVVRSKEAGKGAAADIDGKYNLKLTAGKHTLEYSLIGYLPVTKQITLSDGQTLSLDVQMEEDTKLTDEVVVVGYGVQRKREVTGAIARVEGKELTRFPAPSFEAALQGQAAGVQVTQGSGIAGSGSQVRVRGLASVSSSGDPLYVVDGIPITQDQMLRGSGGGMNTNPLATINPNDIESIEVLKDASATGIYGSRGANGVILITTKRAKKKGLEITYSNRFGVGVAAATPNMMNTEQYLAIRQEAWENDGGTGYVWLPNMTNAGDAADVREAAFMEARKTDTDWVKETSGVGFKMMHSIGISSKKEKNAVYAGVSYDRNGSYLLGNSYTRTAARINWDHDFSKKFKLSTGLSYSNGLNKRVSAAWDGGYGEAMSTALPYYKVYNEDDTYYTWNNGYSNPVMWRQERPWEVKEDRILANLVLTYNLAKDMNIRYTLNYDFLSGREYQYRPKGITPGDNVSSSMYNNWLTPNANSNLTWDYLRTIKENHNFTFLAGAEAQTWKHFDRSETYINTTGMWYNQENRITQPDSSEVIRSYFNPATERGSSLFLSGFARVNYNFKSKYFLQLVGRSDGSSKFGANKKVGFFPSLSAGWIISDENFLKDNKTLSFLKIRGGWGKVGNAAIDQAAQFGNRTVEGTYIGNPILYSTKLPNPNLQWEVSTTTDFAIDYGLFNDRISGSLELYRKFTSDAILNISIPGSTGYTTYTDNVAEILNQGIEFSITSFNVQKKNFNWKTNLNIARNWNELVSIGNYTPDAVSGGTNDTRVVAGEALGTYYMMTFSHVDPATGRPVYIDSKGNQTFQYSNLERVKAGSGLPKWAGGFRNDFQYKNWSLSVFTTFSLGALIYDHSGKNQMGWMNDWNMRTDVLDRWREPGDEASFPIRTFDRANYGQTSDDYNTTTMFIYKANYLRMKNIELGYNFALKGDSKIKNLRVTANVTNLFVITNFPGLEPEIARDFADATDRNLSPNTTYLTPPQEKSFNIGLSATF